MITSAAQVTAYEIFWVAHAKLFAGKRVLSGWYATDNNGDAVHYADPSAVCFCSSGAVLVAEYMYKGKFGSIAAAQKVYDALRAEARILSKDAGMGLVAYNDSLAYKANDKPIREWWDATSKRQGWL